jgi:hypothetical protein
MIARIWRGAVRAQDASAYAAYVQRGLCRQDISTAVFFPDDDQFHIERDLTVNHYEVAGTE